MARLSTEQIQALKDAGISVVRLFTIETRQVQLTTDEIQILLRAGLPPTGEQILGTNVVTPDIGNFQQPVMKVYSIFASTDIVDN